MPFATDPFTLCYGELKSLAQASPRLTSMVRPGNQIWYNDPGRVPPDKDQVGEGDLPELALVVTGLDAALRSTSSGSYATLTYQWQAATGDPNVERLLLPLLWAVYAAMCPWPSTAPQLLWNGQPFIKEVKMTEASLGLSDAARNRGIGGWSALWSTQVVMAFKTQDVIDSNAG
jgi:hypothetical protein